MVAQLLHCGCTLAQFRAVAVSVLSAKTLNVSNSVIKGQVCKIALERAIRDASIAKGDLEMAYLLSSCFGENKVDGLSGSQAEPVLLSASRCYAPGFRFLRASSPS
jgi:hypothetical protein